MLSVDLGDRSLAYLRRGAGEPLLLIQGMAGHHQLWREDFLAQLVGPQVGLAPSDLPGWSGLLVGPLYRGAEVSFQ